MQHRSTAWGIMYVVGRRAFVLAMALLIGSLTALAADPETPGIETRARNALLIDVTTRTVLFEKAPDESIPPASMVKLMTLAVLFKALSDGEVTLDTTFPISEHAWRTGGAPSRTSTMFAELGSEVRVEDLIRGIVVQSANDACIAVAEGMAGSEAAFAARMDALGKEIGLTASRFGNPTGLPDETTRMSVADLAKVALYLIDTYPQFYRIFSETEFTWNKILQRNRNPLFGSDIGADGLKTGYTEAAGYGIVASAVQDGRRLLLVVAGLESPSDRKDEALRLLRLGFDTFQNVTLFDRGEEVSSARVYGGTQRYVPLIAKRPVASTMPVDGREAYRIRVVYNGPVEAPVRQGQQIGALHVYNDKRLVQTTPLFAAREVGVGELHQRALDAAGQLLFGWW